MAVRSTAGGRLGVATESRATMAPPPPHRGSIAAPTGFVRGCRSRGTCGRGRCAAPPGGEAATQPMRCAVRKPAPWRRDPGHHVADPLSHPTQPVRGDSERGGQCEAV